MCRVLFLDAALLWAYSVRTHLIAPLPRLDMTLTRLSQRHSFAAFVLCLAACMDPAPSSTPSQEAIVALERDDVLGAEVNCDTGCDDADPCTDDACVDEACVHEAREGCTIFDCNSLGLMDFETLEGLADGARWKAAAQPRSAPETAECTQMGCDAAEPCCNSCIKALELEVDGGTLTQVTTDQGLEWSCVVDECGEQSSCHPLSVESGYWLWGRALGVDDAREYVVQGWCLQTTSDTLPGTYAGSWVSGSDEAHTVQVTIEHTGSWFIAMSGLRECPSCAYSMPTQQATSIAIRDGGLDFQVAVCDGDQDCTVGQLPVTVSLDAYRDQLIGTFEETQTFGGGFAAPYTGALGLERLDP